MELLTLLIVSLLSLGAGLLVQWLPIRHQPSATYPQRALFLGVATLNSHACRRYPTSYYPMILRLIPFEIEMMPMYPWAVVFVENGLKA